MITDFILGMLVSILNAVLSVLPDMPDKPQVLADAHAWVYSLNYWLPVGEVTSFLYNYLPVYVGALVGLRLYRLIPVVGGK